MLYQVVKHIAKNDGTKSKSVLSPSGNVIETTIHEKAQGKEIIKTFDSNGNIKRTSITENKNNEKNSLITDFYDGGKLVSRILSIEKRPSFAEVSEILYDKSGKILKTRYKLFY